MRGLYILLLRLRYLWAARAVHYPFDPAASLRLDKALLALERELEAGGNA